MATKPKLSTLNDRYLAYAGDLVGFEVARLRESLEGSSCEALEVVYLVLMSQDNQAFYKLVVEEY